MRVAVFDLDGTLADTAADLIAAANGALTEAGFGAPLDAVRDRAVAFAGGRAMLRAGLAGHGAREEAVARLYPRLLELYGDGIVTHTRLYVGVEPALDLLTGAGWRLAVCTNKPEALAECLLSRLGVRARFSAMLGADSLGFRKPDPRHLTETISRAGGVGARGVLIGDTVTDRDTARAAGVPCVLVGFGPEGGAMAELEPAALFSHYDELPLLLDRLLPERAILS